MKLHPSRDPEALAITIVTALHETMEALFRDQGHLFIDQGYTAPERFAMVQRLAESLYRTGLAGYSHQKLIRYIPLALFTDLIWSLFCYAPLALVQTRLVQYFLQQPEFAHHAKQRFLSQMPPVLG